MSRIEADPVIPSLAAQVRAWLFREWDDSLEDSEKAFSPLSEKALFRLRVRERLWDRVLYLLHRLRQLLIPNEKDRALLRLPARFSFLYYLLRPLRLAREHGTSPVKRFLRLLLGW
jgi:hypothetical protein